MPKDPLEYIADTQTEQTRMLHDLTGGMARVEARVDGLADRLMQADREQTIRLNDHDARLNDLEHSHTRAKAAISVLWWVLGLGGTAVGTVIGWLLNQH